MKAWNILLILVVVIEALTLCVRLASRPSHKLPELATQVLRPPMARDAVRAMQNLHTQSPAEWQRAAKMLRAIGFYPEAEYCCRQLDALEPNNPRHLRDWASVLGRLGRTAESTEKFLLALKAGDTAPQDCWLGIGQNRLREEGSKGAIDALCQAPYEPRAQYLLCRALYRRGRAKEARQRLEQIIREHPGGLQFAKLMSWTMYELGELDDAEKYRQLSARSENLYMPDVFMQEDTRLREQLGDGAVIREALALEAKKQGAVARDKMAKVLDEAWTERAATSAAQLAVREGNFEEARRLLEACLARYSDTIETLLALGEAYAALGDEAHARQAWLRATRILGSAESHTLLADSYQRSGDLKEAARHQALARFQQGKLWWKRNALPDARIELTAAAEMLPDHAHGWFYLADTLRELGDIDAARAAYEMCLAIHPEHGRAHHGLMLLEKTK